MDVTKRDIPYAQLREYDDYPWAIYTTVCKGVRYLINHQMRNHALLGSWVFFDDDAGQPEADLGPFPATRPNSSRPAAGDGASFE